jgi:hypothetical protein
MSNTYENEIEKFSLKKLNLLKVLFCCLIFIKLFTCGLEVSAAEKVAANKTDKKAVDAILEKATQLKNEKHYRESYALVMPLADKGNPAAMFLVSKLLSVWDTPENLVPDFKLAAIWIQRAAEKKYPAALAGLSDIILDQHLAEYAGLEVDVDRGVKLAFEAEKLGYVESMVSIARLYSDGIGLPVDKKEALRWYDKYEQVSGKTSFGRQYFIQNDISTRVGRDVCVSDLDYPPRRKPFLHVKFSGGRSAELKIVGTIVSRSDSYEEESLLVKSITATYENGQSANMPQFNMTDWDLNFTVGKETWVKKIIFINCN